MKRWLWMGMIAVIVFIYCAPTHTVSEQPVFIQDSIALSEEIDSLHMGYDRGYYVGRICNRHEFNERLIITNCCAGCLGGLSGCYIGTGFNVSTESQYYHIVGAAAGGLLASTPLVYNAAKRKYIPEYIPLGDSLYKQGFIDGYSNSKKKRQLFSAVSGGFVGISYIVFIIYQLTTNEWGP